MLDTQQPLHMVQMILDGRDLQRSARRQRLPNRCTDTGYLLHGHLNALFGDLLPQPFHSIPSRGDVEVLGYCRSDDTALRQQVETFAEPMAKDSLKRLASKTMPEDWPPGRRLGFEVRVCPVVRLSSATHRFRARQEVDAFEAAKDRHEDPESLDRYETYFQWLAKRFDDAATIQRIGMKRYRRIELFRRTQEARRRGRLVEYPEALMFGELEILDTDAFRRLLERGIGRHRSFGFGMLRLRPPQR